MTDQGEVLRLASLEEAPRLFQLILRRITWLEERGIRQWERDDYLTYYPLTYFQERARNGALYGLWRPDGAPNVVAVLLEEDDRWPAGGSALYIHNLAANPDAQGAGERMLRQCMALAKAMGKDYLRLDCGRNNPALNDYYERLGFSYVGPMEVGSYQGNLRQRPLL